MRVSLLCSPASRDIAIPRRERGRRLTPPWRRQRCIAVPHTRMPTAGAGGLPRVYADAAGVIVDTAAVLGVGSVLSAVGYQGDLDVVRSVVAELRDDVVAGPRPPAVPRDGDSSRGLKIRLRFWLLSYRRSF